MSDSQLSDMGAASAAPKFPTPKAAFKRRSKRLRVWFPYLLVAPAVAYLLMITLYPASMRSCKAFMLSSLVLGIRLALTTISNYGATTNFGALFGIP